MSNSETPIDGRRDLYGANRTSAGTIGYINVESVIRRGHARMMGNLSIGKSLSQVNESG